MAKTYSREVRQVLNNRIEQEQEWMRTKLARREVVVADPDEDVTVEDPQKMGYCGDCGRSNIPDVYEFEIDPILDVGKSVSPRRKICDECYQGMVIRADKIEEEQGIEVMIKPIKIGVVGGGNKKRR